MNLRQDTPQLALSLRKMSTKPTRFIVLTLGVELTPMSSKDIDSRPHQPVRGPHLPYGRPTRTIQSNYRKGGNFLSPQHATGVGLDPTLLADHNSALNVSWVACAFFTPM